MSSRDAGRRYVRRFVPAMIGYVVLLVPAILIINRFPAAPWRYAVVLVPIVPLAFVARAVVGFLRETDELQRRMQLEALGFAFGVGSVITFAVGLLQIVGLPTLSWMFVWPVFAVLWVLGLALAKRRY